MKSSWQKSNFPTPLILIPFHKNMYGPIDDEYVKEITNEKTVREDFFQGYEVIRSTTTITTTSQLPKQHFTQCKYQLLAHVS